MPGNFAQAIVQVYALCESHSHAQITPGIAETEATTSQQ